MILIDSRFLQLLRQEKSILETSKYESNLKLNIFRFSLPIECLTWNVFLKPRLNTLIFKHLLITLKFRCSSILEISKTCKFLRSESVSIFFSVDPHLLLYKIKFFKLSQLLRKSISVNPSQFISSFLQNVKTSKQTKFSIFWLSFS